MKKWILILGGLIISFIVIKVYQLIQWYNVLGVGFTGRPKKVSNGNLILNCQAKLDNPKDLQMTITKPTIRIYRNGVLLGYSEPSSQKITIRSNKITTINYEIIVPLKGEFLKLLLSSGTNVYSQIMSGDDVADITLGQTFDVIAYMQVYGIERSWKQKLTI